ncbi:MAG: C1 family peptidase [Odoribacter splanchnicus]
MKKTLITTTLFLACFGVFAQALSEKDLQEIQSSFKKDASTKAIQNILTADKDIKGNALNRDLQGKIDHYFKYRADVKGITNQLSSGRCWMFTSMNVLRPSIMKIQPQPIRFFTQPPVFLDIFEKSNLFLEKHHRNRRNRWTTGQ